MWWLYLHFPSLQLDGIQQSSVTLEKAEKQAQGKAVIVIDRQLNEVRQLNDIARALGVTPGMGLATAIALSGELVIVEYNPKIEQTRLHELAQWLYQKVADIALFEPDGLALEVSSMLSLYDDVQSYWQAIQNILQHQQVSYQRAVANTPLAARLLAKDSHKPLNNDSHLIERQLGRLSVQQLELAQVHVEQLQRVGIHQLKHLLPIAGKELGRRFGLEVLNHLGRIKGDIRQPLTFFEPPLHFRKNLELFHEIGISQVLLFPLKRMIQEMETFLNGRELVVTSITITLLYRDGEPTSLTIGSASGEYKADKWMTLVTLNIERTRLNAAVVGITLTSGELIEKNATVDDMFCGAKGNMTPAQLISLLQARVGKERIVGIQLHQDHRPEHAFSYKKPLKQASTLPGAFPSILPKIRPLILLPEPQPLTEQYTVLEGPERVRSAWWGKQEIYRDYFIARDNQGAVCWLFTEPQGTWFLHGYFC